MRFVAAFGIVWAHLEAPLMAVGYAALGLFVTLTAVLAFASAERRPGGRFLRGRVVRLLLPWAGWCAFYLVLEAARLRDPARIWTLTDWRWLLIGPVIHLWFLPFVLLGSPLVLGATRVLTGARAVWLAAVCAAPVALGAIRLHDGGTLEPPFIQWAYAATPLFYGILSAAAGRQNAWPAPLVFIALATVPAIALWDSLLAAWLLAAALLFELFWRAEIRARALPRLGALAFGIYLVHPFFMLVWFRIMGDDSPRALAAVAVFLASALAAQALRLLPSGRRIPPSPAAAGPLSQGMIRARTLFSPIRRRR